MSKKKKKAQPAGVHGMEAIKLALAAAVVSAVAAEISVIVDKVKKKLN